MPIMKIGFFDSGVGGLTIMNSVRDTMPHYDYIFYGDTKHLPYGNRPESEIYTLTRNGVEYLFREGALVVIIACNTASAETLRKLQDTYLMKKYPQRKILGVIIPTIEEVIEQRKKKVLLIGTTRTVNSRKYELEMEKCMIRPISLTGIATPELVPLIEHNNISDAVHFLEPILMRHIESGGDSLILGCTHYVLIKEPLRRVYGKDLTVLSQDEIIPDKLQKYLFIHNEIESKLSRGGSKKLYLTGT